MQKSKKNSSQKAEKRELHANNVVENHFRLGHCATLYAKSIANPFTGPPDACFPVTPCVMSQKVRTFVRTQISCGAAGEGFFAMSPMAANDGSTAAGQVGTAAVYVSNSGYAGTGIPALNPATGGVIGANHNGPFGISQFLAGPGGAQCRLVSMGARLRYAGTEMDRGGRIVLLEDPDHAQPGTQSLSMAELLSYEKTKEHPVKGSMNSGSDWTTLCSTGPVMPSEYDFQSFARFPDNNAAGNFYLKGLIQSKTGNKFDIEFFWNWELIGAIVRGKTYSESDDQGVAVVLGAIKSVNDTQLDSKHPLVVSGRESSVNTQNLQRLVQTYASKQTSGWLAGAVRSAESFYGKAKPYLSAGVNVAEHLAPLLML